VSSLSIQLVSGQPSPFKLTALQRIGLRYAEEFNKTIHRQQVAQVEAVVKEGVVVALHRITGMIEGRCCGGAAQNHMNDWLSHCLDTVLHDIGY